MLSALVLGALVLVPGIPLALVVGRSASRRWSSVAVEGLVLGLCWWVLVGLWLSHAGWFDPWQLAVPTLVLVAALAVPAWREARTIDRPVPTWFGGFLAVLLVVALVLRREPFYFLYRIGDFAEYVNRANAVAEGAGFVPWFTRGFTVALSLTNHALGEARTVELMPFLGIVLIAIGVEVATRLRAGLWARATVAVVLTFAVLPVWYSRFPASETLYAVLQLGMVLLLVGAVQRESRSLAVAAAVVAGVMLMVRGNGVLLGPILVVLVGVCAFVVRRRTLDVLLVFLVTALWSLGLAFTANARFSHDYFIAEQLPKFVPDALFEQLAGMGGLRFALPRLVGLVAVSLVLAVALRWLHGLVGPERDGAMLALLRRAVLPAVVVVFALVSLVVGPDGLLDALGRYELVVLLLGAVGIGAALWRFADRLDDDERVVIAAVVVIGGAFAVLFAERLPNPRYAPYFLYWDRYLFSETWPLVVLATMWAVALLDRLDRRAMTAVGTSALAALGLSLFAGGAVTRERVFMDDAYEQLRAVDELLDEREVPIAYSGVPKADTPVKVLCHETTRALVASPLAATFGRRFLNLGLPVDAPDPVLDTASLVDVLDERDVDRAYLVQVTVPDSDPASIGDGALSVTPVGTTTLSIPMLDRPLADGWPIDEDPIAGCARHGDPRWDEARFDITVSLVER
ncbi:MAG TPA: hypothetical protein VFU93_00125 [Acidimicrobiales bacterium]|nr:hypothetical protein [Acidimicrobiales bacterium]